MKNFAKFSLFLVLPLFLCAFMPVDEAPTAKVRTFKLKMTSAKGKVLTATAPGGTDVKVQTKRRAFAVSSRVFNDTIMVVSIFRYNSTVADLGALSVESMTKIKEGKISPNQSLKHTFPNGGEMNHRLEFYLRNGPQCRWRPF